MEGESKLRREHVFRLLISSRSSIISAGIWEEELMGLEQFQASDGVWAVDAKHCAWQKAFWPNVIGAHIEKH